MTTALLLTVCVLIVGIWLYLFSFSMMHGSKISAILIGATLFHETLLIIIPTVYAALNDYSFEEAMFATVTSLDVLTVMLGELLFTLAFVVGFEFMPEIRGSRNSLAFVNNGKLYAETFTIKLLVIAGNIIYVSQLFPDFVGESQLITSLTTSFWYTSIAVSVLILVDGKSANLKRGWNVAAAVNVIALIGVTFTTGARGRVLSVLSLFICAAFLFNRRKLLLLVAPLLLVLAPVFSVLGTAETRFNIIDGLSPWAAVRSVYEIATSNSMYTTDTSVVAIESYIGRAQGVRNSVTLYQDHAAGGGGFAVYLGALTSFIPSYLWNDKPVLGSDGNGLEGYAMYKVVRLGYDRQGEMGPLLASAHAYWEGGWIWVALAGIATGMLWRFVFLGFEVFPNIIYSVIALSFGAAFLVDGFTTMLNPIYSFINIAVRSVIPLLIIYKFAPRLSVRSGMRFRRQNSI